MTQEDREAQALKEWRWTKHVRCAALSRSQLRKQLGRWGISSLEETAVLLHSELWSNAYRHSPVGRKIVTRWILYSDRLRLEVEDSATCMPEVKHPTDDEENGRGLLLVEAFSDKWGVEPRSKPGEYAPGKVVWCELSL